MAVQVAVFADEPSFWRNGDIDIFATYKGAPHARDRLVRNCHLRFVGITERYEHTEENSHICFQRVENYGYEGDSDDRAFVQLIIGKPGIYDATRLLDAFDLDICKCAIMTDRFIIQRPFHTFLFRTMLNPGHSCLIIHDDRY